MKAIGYLKNLPIDSAESFIELDLPKPKPTGKDLLVKVKAVSVNPVDTKVRFSGTVKDLDAPKVIGWDSSGIVEEVGEEVTLFKKGDEVYYSGSIQRAGSNSEYHLVDERITGFKPKSLSFAEAAAMPLTTITAWESIFDRLSINENSKGAILIINGAGGVGSIAIQLLKQLTNLKIFATASRKESQDWVKELGADEIIDHSKDIKSQLEKIGHKEIEYILCLNKTEEYFPLMAEIIKPQGKICTIVETKDNVPLPMNLIKNKSVTFAWEMMFARSSYQTEDMIEQHNLLNKVGEYIDVGKIKHTMNVNLGVLNVENLKKAHKMIESKNVIGKIVLENK